jgi:hypothetical protein
LTLLERLLTGNGTLEIALTPFDHGPDVCTAPRSGTGCLS